MFRFHPSANVLSSQIGEDTVIWQYSIVLAGAVIGRNCNINCNVFIENDVIIGDNVTIKAGVQIWDGLRIGDNVFIGPNATFTNDILPRSKVYPVKFKGTILEEGASIGANATVVAGNTIGRYAMIGAGSVITKNVPPFSLWYGNPARMHGYITRDGIILNMEMKDAEGNQYEIIDNNLVKL